ncbi:MAG: DUF559 domain-containing protein [Nitrobacter sp.]
MRGHFPSSLWGEGRGEGVRKHRTRPMTKNTPIARRLRQSQTDAERALWLRLRDRRLAGLEIQTTGTDRQVCRRLLLCRWQARDRTRWWPARHPNCSGY